MTIPDLVTPVIVDAPCGKLQGLSKAGLTAFKGVPFAEPPVVPDDGLRPASVRPGAASAKPSTSDPPRCRAQACWTRSSPNKSARSPKIASTSMCGRQDWTAASAP